MYNLYRPSGLQRVDLGPSDAVHFCLFARWSFHFIFGDSIITIATTHKMTSHSPRNTAAFSLFSLLSSFLFVSLCFSLFHFSSGGWGLLFFTIPSAYMSIWPGSWKQVHVLWKAKQTSVCSSIGWGWRLTKRHMTRCWGWVPAAEYMPCCLRSRGEVGTVSIRSVCGQGMVLTTTFHITHVLILGWPVLALFL